MLEIIDNITSRLNQLIEIAPKWVLPAVGVIVIVGVVYFGTQELSKYFCKTDNYIALKAMRLIIDFLYSLSSVGSSVGTENTLETCSRLRIF